MKSNFIFCPLLAVGLLLVLNTGCKKDSADDASSISKITFNPNITYGNVKDVDGNSYKTVTIGTQTWMAENLKVTKYRNGDVIPNVTDSLKWESYSEALCDVNNDPKNTSTYGKLYNWYAVTDARHLAPEGWHIPSMIEWELLETTLGGDVLGGILMESGSTHWNDGVMKNTNETGFTAIPAGYRDYHGRFKNTNIAYFWTNHKSYDGFAWYYFISSSTTRLKHEDFMYQKEGLSVRCVKD